MNFLIFFALAAIMCSQVYGGKGCGTRKFKCGLDLAHSIVGGQNAVKGCLPWQAHLSNGCGGTIIDKRWILTAAHCAISYPRPGVDTVSVGAYDLRKKEDGEQTIDIEKVFIHPKFDRYTLNNDVALFKLSEDINFNDYVQLACLPSSAVEKEDYEPGNLVIISGWGVTSEVASPNILQVATVPFISHSTCNKDYKKTHYNITDSMVCAGKPGTDTCQGDSGGPVAMSIKGKFTVLGITSFGIGCARPNFPGVYTNVAYELGWINDTIARN